jgi:hypothetical protein
LRKLLLLIASLCSIFLLGASAYGQQIDGEFGLSTVLGPSASSATGDHSPQSVGGGVFPSFSGSFLIRHRVGFNGEIAWRASQNQYLDIVPFRPIFYDFNAIWSPRLAHLVTVDLMGGIGGESVRFYQGIINCSFTGCTNYTSTNHFLGHFGGGVRFYVFGNVFVRPEAHLYLVHNNVEFSGARAERVGASIGYSFGGK